MVGNAFVLSYRFEAEIKQAVKGCPQRMQGLYFMSVGLSCLVNSSRVLHRQPTGSGGFCNMAADVHNPSF